MSRTPLGAALVYLLVGCGASGASAPSGRLAGEPDAMAATKGASPGEGVAAVSLPDGCGPAGEAYRCNPVSNAGCNTAAGEACDDDQVGGFKCYPAPNQAKDGAACADDDDGPSCAPGLGCAGTSESNPEGTCARYCCADAECGNKKCAAIDGKSGSLGFCR